MAKDNRLLANWLIGLADDEFILGQRLSEWCGHAPILEEDIAFANLSLDEIGHAAQWYALAGDLLGENPDIYPDKQIFFRDPEEFRNIQMVELPNEDWAFSMLRQYLFDTAELTRLNSLTQSKHEPLADAAAKIRKEEVYHTRHTQAWIERLGQGTEESHQKLQDALLKLWPYTRQLFSLQADEELLVKEGVIPDLRTVQAKWIEMVNPVLRSAGLKLPDQENIAPPKRDEHTPEFKFLVAEMQSVARLDPEAIW